MADLEVLAKDLSSLTVMEAASLVKMLEEQWGVSAAAPVAVAAAGAAPAAAEAAEEQTGARGLVSAVERVLLRFEKKLPSTDILYLVVTEDLVRDPAGTLERILANPDDPELTARYERCLTEERQVIRSMIDEKIEKYQQRFGETLTERRIELVVEHAVLRGADLMRTFEEMVRLYKTIRYHERRFYERFDIRINQADFLHFAFSPDLGTCHILGKRQPRTQDIGHIADYVHDL